jgi:hypothetical protein
MEDWWNDTDKETEYGALVKWYWQGKAEYEAIVESYWQGKTEYGGLVEWYWQGNWIWSIGEMILTGETEISGEKPVPAPLSPPQIALQLTRDTNRPEGHCNPFILLHTAHQEQFLWAQCGWDVTLATHLHLLQSLQITGTRASRPRVPPKCRDDWLD